MVLYTTDCPRCKVLERKMSAKGIGFTTNHDVQDAIDNGFTSAPVLRTDDGRYLGFSDANVFVNAYYA